MSMFCFQCQEAAKNTGCTVAGACGKTGEVANLQDLLIYLQKGISLWGVMARDLGVHSDEVDLFVAEALFSTITNVNFDADRMVELIEKSLKMRDKIRNLFLKSYKQKFGKEFAEKLPDPATWTGSGKDEFVRKSGEVGVLSEKNEDIRSLKELLIYGLKGMAAYTDHAYVLKHANSKILAFIQKALAATVNESVSADELVGLVLGAGEMGVQAMALLDAANTSTYGNPEITQVYTGSKPGPGILVSGHDLLDFEEILKQTEGTGVNVYTHGEMLPANAYPEFKKYPHLAGNIGTSWYNQQKEFDQFNGPVVMTTNCIVKPLESYKDRIFTTGLAGWPGVNHIPNRVDGGHKDFSGVIEKAKELEDVGEIPGKLITIGFAHASTLSVADKVVEAVKSGAIKRFVVMAGCDGRHKSREYYTKVAEELPKDTVILTAGCAKYRYNMLDLGDIGGIPRVIDAGQCNDSYSLVVVAQKLAEVFGVTDINDLPISYDIAWYEQKAVIVLLALLYLGVKGIVLGPTLPAFLSPGVAKVLVEKFDIKPISTVEKDVELIMA